MVGKMRLLVTKGNLRHRIAKLGTEALDDGQTLTEDQRELRRVACEHQFGDPEDAQAGDEEARPPERPPWASGAFVYLNKVDAREARQEVQKDGVKLQSKHILVSDDVFPVLQRVLEARPPGSGRDAFLTARAGAIQEERILGEPAGTSQGGPSEDRLKKFQLVTLGAGALDAVPSEAFDHDTDVVDFLYSPSYLQEQDPDTWLVVWQKLSQENRWWIELQGHPDDLTPRCLVCDECSTLRHLMSEDCRRNITARSLSAGHLLGAILAAARHREEKRDAQLRPSSSSLRVSKAPTKKKRENDQGSSVPCLAAVAEQPVVKESNGERPIVAMSASAAPFNCSPAREAPHWVSQESWEQLPWHPAQPLPERHSGQQDWDSWDWNAGHWSWEQAAHRGWDGWQSWDWIPPQAPDVSSLINYDSSICESSQHTQLQ